MRFYLRTISQKASKMRNLDSGNRAIISDSEKGACLTIIFIYDFVIKLNKMID